MNKKSWKKKLLPEFIVFMVVMAILALSFLTADNQRKQWIEDNGNEAENFSQTFLSKGYIPEVSEVSDKPAEASKDTITVTPTEVSADGTAQAAEASAIKKPAEDSEAILGEPRVLHSSAISPDSKYIAETYGVNRNITAGGLYPAREIRIRELATDRIVWSMMGCYSCNLLWTQDSRYLTVSYTTRIYGETVIVDTKDFTTVMVPIPEQIEENMQEFRPDVYLYAMEWKEELKLLINFTYTGKDSAEHSGSFIYDLITGIITDYQVIDSLIDNSPIDLAGVKPEGNISTTYIDGCDTLDELVQKAEVIVKGTAGRVVSEKQMGVLISFHIENTIKGDTNHNNNKLRVLQLKDGNKLIEGETYVLALGKDYEEDTYHVIGGYQGIFSIIDNELYCKESKYQDELISITDNENSTSISKLDLLCDNFLSRIIKSE